MKKDKKTIYESPVVVPLGDLAKGSGFCTQGSLHADTGGGPPGLSKYDCFNGPSPINPGGQQQNCTQGGNPK